MVSFAQIHANGGSQPAVHIQQADSDEIALGVDVVGTVSSPTFSVKGDGTVYAGGNVGIGTAAPSYLLDIKHATSNAQARLESTSNSSILILDAKGDGENEGGIVRSSSWLKLDAGNATKMTILSTGNVGIGTNAPGTLLHMAGGTSIRSKIVGTNDVSVGAEATGTDSQSFLYLINDARQWTIMNDGAISDIFKIRDTTATADRFVIDSSGNVGIGTTAPYEKFHVMAAGSGSSGYSGAVTRGILITDNLGPRLVLEDIGEGTDKKVISLRNEDQEIKFGSMSDTGGAYDVDNILVVHRDGNVGIGTAAPNHKFEVAGGSILVDNNSAYRAKNTGGVARSLLTLSNDNNLYVQSPSDIVFQTNQDASTVNSMAVKTTGRVGIGTIEPTTNLHVSGASPDILLENQTAGAVAYQLKNTAREWHVGSDNSPDHFYIRDHTQTANRFIIDNAGLVGIGGTPSDGPLHIFTSHTGAQRAITIENTSGDEGGDASIQFEATGANVWNVGLDNSDSDSFKISQTELGSVDRVTVTTAGKVGIGTTDPAELLTVAGNISAYGSLKLRALGSNQYFKLEGGTNTLGVKDWDGTSIITFDGSTNNVGIGTSAPAELLTVAGNISANGEYYIHNQSEPATPTDGGVLYVEAGALKYKGSSGTVTTLGNA